MSWVWGLGVRALGLGLRVYAVQYHQVEFLRVQDEYPVTASDFKDGAEQHCLCTLFCWQKNKVSAMYHSQGSRLMVIKGTQAWIRG